MSQFAHAPSSAFEVVRVSTAEVSCDGGGGALGHPRVFLHIDFDQGGRVTCPYCSRTFAFATSARKEA